MKDILKALLQKNELSHAQLQLAFAKILDGSAHVCQSAAFLSLLRAKGESPGEIASIASTLYTYAQTIQVHKPLLDIVGTGGDHANTINISTGSAIIAASCGVSVAKHGNRSVSSQCGSADVLEALGIPIEFSPDTTVRCLNTLNIAFLFAPLYHSAWKPLREVRKSLFFPTVMNLVGPLLNPARASYLLYGVYAPELVAIAAEAISRMGYRKALVFHGHGLDELSSIGPIDALLVDEGCIQPIRIDPAMYGLQPCITADLKGGSPSENASTLMRIFQGEPGPIADTLLLNAGVAIWLYGLAPSIAEGIHQARQALSIGKTEELLQKWKSFT